MIERNERRILKKALAILLIWAISGAALGGLIAPDDAPPMEIIGFGMLGVAACALLIALTMWASKALDDKC